MDPLTPETKAMDIPSLLTGGGGVAALGIVMKYGSRIFRNRTIDLRTDKTRMWDRIKELEQAREGDRKEFLDRIEALTLRIAALEREKIELISKLTGKEAELALLRRDYHDAGEMINQLEGKLARRCANCQARA